MRMGWLLALGGVSLALGVSAGTASAQIGAVPIDVMVCDSTRFDFNGDGRLGKSDLMLYWNNVQRAGCVDSPAGNEGCGSFDLDGNGTVEFADLNFAYNIFVSCAQPVPPETFVRPRPR